MEAARPRSGGSALVVGSIGFEVLRPVRLARGFYRPYAVAVGVVQEPCRADLGPWRGLDWLTLVPEDGAEVAVRDVRALSCRMPVPPGPDLAALANDPLVREFLRLLLDSPGLTVGEVARCLGSERHYPARATRRRTGLTMRDVRLAYVLHYYNAERARGVPLNRIGVGLDYSRSSHLLDALRAARRRFGAR